MYLKQLEIKGFKSFADKIDLEFGNGITAIVGPNGSGKSNISDAVRWVLGEQSAKTLRGGKMEDVIFSGTENRKPLGCSEVSLTIDNTDRMLAIDFTEVTVTRRLYRSGESEYLINNIPYRLKDITELFMDTGIGKDGYSLIGQGKIDEILSTKSEDRRNLFEEAAGIVKYRSRKQESEKKLENTEQNLIRITDIIGELEEQLEPLKNQSETAKKYLALREELKDLEINVILYNYESGKNKLDKISHDIQELTEGKGAMELKKGEALAVCQGLKQELEKLELEYKASTDSRLEIEKNYENKQGNLKLLNERHDNLVKEIERITKDIDDEKIVLLNIDKECGLLTDKRQALIDDIQSQEAIVNSLNTKYQEIADKCREFETGIENSKTDLIQMLKDTSDLNNKISMSRMNIENIENRIRQIDREIGSRKEKIELIISETDKIQGRIAELNRNSGEEKIRISEVVSQMNTTESQNERLRNSRNSIFDKLKTYEARFNTLNAMENDMEGFNKAVKAVVSNYRDGNRVFGAVSDLIKVPKGYEIAIEIALSAAVQNIVVDNENTAGELINYLKRNNIGRATFLPLTTIKPRRANIDGSISKTDGYIGLASDIVQYDSKYSAAISNLLGRIIICDGMESAKIIAKRADYSYKIVTLEGDVVNSGGSFTGGSTNLKNSGIFSRKNEIAELIEIIENEKKNLSRIEEEIRVNNENIAAKRLELDERNLCLQNITIELNGENNKLGSLNRERGEIEESIKDVEIEATQLKLEAQKNNEFIEKTHIQVNDLIEKQRNLELETDRMQIDSRKYQQDKDECLNEITQEKIKLAEKNKTMESLNESLGQFDREKYAHNQKIILYENMIGESKDRIEKELEYIYNLTHEIEEISKEILLIRHRIGDLELKKSELNTNISAAESDIQKNEEGINDITNSIYKLEISKSKIEVELDGMAGKLWDEYELTIPEAVKYKHSIGSISETNRRVNELKQNIRELGDVNVNSIEEYKRVKERFEFLQTQKEDLIKAQESLIEIIEEMTAKMTEMFKEKFKIIRENFSYTFKELFGGGYADLRLEGDDVLNSGIEIIVQPPGKKLQNLTLLSGGERGLAAIALLFAILKMKPTPFCVLDEIEAALDDANVNRYAQFLRKYSKNTQFITITHRKGSMAVADALYGVTMEEKGISKMISLKLSGGN